MLGGIAVVVLVVLRVGSARAEPNYFPLEIGNRWTYQCTLVRAPGYQHSGEAICSAPDSNARVLAEMAVTDTLRLQQGSAGGGRWLTRNELPISSEGVLYYLLEGDLLRKIGLRLGVELHDALLVRKARTLNGIEEKGILFPGLVEGAIVAGAARSVKDRRWLLFVRDMVLWHPNHEDPETYWSSRSNGRELGTATLAGIEYMSEFEYIYDTTLVGDLVVSVPAGTCSDIRAADVWKAYTSMPGLLGRHELYFAPGVGIVRVGRERASIWRASASAVARIARAA